ncbi:hypothetical protein [Xenophilus sp.]|uniref:hypothetical protein n=1 Tax=Xenophilus sp. TaxID=1873499 RepID=UPI0037DD7BCB
MADTRTMRGLDGVLSTLELLPKEIVSKRGGPVKSALRKGGVVVQKAMQANIRRVVTDTVAHGYVSTKVLEKAIVVRRDSNPRRSGASERYRVLIARGRKYPDGRMNKGKPVTAVMTGRWLEYGNEEQQAEPWATPAYMASREAALKEVVDDLRRGVQRAILKYRKGRY